MKVSVIVPVFNEEDVIGQFLQSLIDQSHKDFEVIVVDDGSTDNSKFKIQNSKFKKIKLIEQKHQGPGEARNLGAKNAGGKILVFVDADMTFDKDFLKKLIEPIEGKKAIGTFSKEEYVANKDNVWSKCWNINKGLPLDRMHPKNYPDEQPVFRAILKKEFGKVGGFSSIGYIDDYTLSEKLGVKAKVAQGAVFYHKNPENLTEVFAQARWIGKSEYKRRKIKQEFLMKLVSIVRYSLPFSLVNGLIGAIQFSLPEYLIFKIFYDLAVETSLLRSFFGEQLYK